MEKHQKIQVSSDNIVSIFKENENDTANYKLAWFSHGKIREKQLRD